MTNRTTSARLKSWRKEHDMEEKKGFKKVSMEEMNKISGGVIVRDRGAYWLFSDTLDENGNFIMDNVGYGNKNEVIREAERKGWSTRILTKEEFEEEYGIENFNPYKYVTDNPIW